jgi:hypothetical protein
MQPARQLRPTGGAPRNWQANTRHLLSMLHPVVTTNKSICAGKLMEEMFTMGFYNNYFDTFDNAPVYNI